jgi:hypothetical protein
MTDFDWQIIIPNVPPAKMAVFDIVTLGVLAMFKLDRGRLLKRNANYIDRFGWSIILFDLGFGIIFLGAVVRTLYPALESTQAHVGSTLLLFALAMWQWIEVRSADWHRVNRAMDAGPVMVGITREIEERRQVVRREEDRQLRAQLREYQREDRQT